MKFAEDTNHARYLIRAYSDDSVTINNIQLSSSFILSPSEAPEQWPVSAIATLQPQQLEQLLSKNPELLLLGVGKIHQPLTAELLKPLIHSGIGYEVMSTTAAIRSYNLLANDGRQLLLAAILP